MARTRTRTPDSVLAALGFTAEQDRVYRQALSLSGSDLVTIAGACQLTPDAVLETLAEPFRLGLVREDDQRLFVLDPAEAVVRMLDQQATETDLSRRRLEGLSLAVQHLYGASAGPAPGTVNGVRPIDGEVSAGGQPVALLTSLIRESRGDLLWWRPDQFREPREDAMAAVVAEAIAAGRSSRAVYPARALTEAMPTLVARAQVGEQIRVVPELPSRLLIIGRTHAITPEPLGFADEPRLLIRQRGLVEALALLFELMWEKATPVVGLERGAARPDLRRLLLQQLAAGAKDEQIARALGTSLRTVRRRIADLLIELGVDSRFQAGVEAARRGWL
jgi:hypothetical protein